MTKIDFSKGIKIYKSHKLKGKLISITYASKLGKNAISTQRTVVIDDKGGALTSLYYDKTGKKK